MRASAGAGDRLGLECEHTGEYLPAAMLPYSGRTMLEGLIRDLQAREYLYFKLTGEQVSGRAQAVCIQLKCMCLVRAHV